MIKNIALATMLMCGIFLPTHVYAQVEVKQSTTVNGQTTKQEEKFIPCQGIPGACNASSIVGIGGYAVSVHVKGDKIEVRFCKSLDVLQDTCHNYVLNKNGTLTEEEVKK